MSILYFIFKYEHEKKKYLKYLFYLLYLFLNNFQSTEFLQDQMI